MDIEQQRSERRGVIQGELTQLIRIRGVQFALHQPSQPPRPTWQGSDLDLSRAVRYRVHRRYPMAATLDQTTRDALFDAHGDITDVLRRVRAAGESLGALETHRDIEVRALLTQAEVILVNRANRIFTTLGI